MKFSLPPAFCHGLRADITVPGKVGSVMQGGEICRSKLTTEPVKVLE